MSKKGKPGTFIFSLLMVLFILLTNAHSARGELKLDLSLDNAVFLLEEPLAGKVVFTNTGTDTIRLISTDIYVGLLKFYMSYEEGEKWEFRPAISATIIVDENTGVWLAPGKSFSQQVIFEYWTWRRHPTGTYEVQADYEGTKSNTVTFTLAEPQGIDKEAYNLLKFRKYEGSDTSFVWLSSGADQQKSYEQILLLYPQSTYAKYAQYQRALGFHIDHDSDRALSELQKVTNNYPYFCYTDDARVRLGQTYYDKGNKQVAKAVFEQLMVSTYDNMKSKVAFLLQRYGLLEE